MPVKGFNSASLTYIATCVAISSYFCHLNDPGASYGYYTGIVAILYCIIAASCIHTLLRAIFLGKKDK